MSEYLIQGETLEAIADEVRRLIGTEDPLSPTEMATALASSTGIPSCDELIFFGDSLDPAVSIGESGYITPDTDGSCLWGLEYLKKHYISPPVTEVDDDVFTYNWGFSDYISSMLVGIKLSSCTMITHSLNSNILVLCEMPECMMIGDSGATFLDACQSLERLVLNSACAIAEKSLPNYVDRQATLKIYLKGTSVGSCSPDAFGGGVPSRVEIYVPPSLLNDFKTTWADGAFSDIIYADPEVST